MQLGFGRFLHAKLWQRNAWLKRRCAGRLAQVIPSRGLVSIRGGGFGDSAVFGDYAGFNRGMGINAYRPTYRWPVYHNATWIIITVVSNATGIISTIARPR